MKRARLLLCILAACGRVWGQSGSPAVPAKGDVARRLRAAEIHLAEERLSEAVIELRAAELAAPPDSAELADICERLGRIFLDLREDAQAHEAFQKGLGIVIKLKIKGEARARLLAGLGTALSRQSRFTQASRAFKAGTALGPGPAADRDLQKGISRNTTEEGLARGSVLPDPSAPPARIRAIIFHGNRTQAWVLRRVLPFKEGDNLQPDGLWQARESLYRLQLFKQIAVSSSPAGAGEADVQIFVRDGWYLVPFPFGALGAGGARAGLYVAGRNVLRRSESLFIMGLQSTHGRRAGFGGSWLDYSIEASHERHRAEERSYEDGGFSAPGGLGAPVDQNKAGNFGFLNSTYLKSEESGALEFGLPLTVMGARLAAKFGWDYSMIRYAPKLNLPPPDSGRYSQLTFAANWGLRAGGPVDATDLGAVLGFGMADIEERLKPLPRPRYDPWADVRASQAGRATGADFAFSALRARAGIARSWGRQQQFTVEVAGGRGWGLPPARLLATSALLQGNYAREFRGHSTAGMGIRYSHPFRMTRRGVWQGILFGDGAVAADRGTRAKMGAGFGFGYRFWRFPIPLGLTYTHSFDDRDSQLSGVLGGRF